MVEIERIVGLDVGDVRIGVAVSDALGITAQPRTTIERSTPLEDVLAVQRVAEESDAGRIVVGLPLNQEGQCGDQANKVLAFIDTLRERTGLKVVTVDERFTTALAERTLINANVRRKRRKGVIDQLAAQQILQTYLDRQARRRAKQHE